MSNPGVFFPTFSVFMDFFPSFPALEGSEGLREFLEQEFVTWLMSSELCRAT